MERKDNEREIGGGNVENSTCGNSSWSMEVHVDMRNILYLLKFFLLM